MCSHCHWHTFFILLLITQFGVQKNIPENNEENLRNLLNWEDNKAPLAIQKKNSTKVRTSRESQDDEESFCNPPSAEGISQFIIGYGSLMQMKSKDRTSPETGESIPVRIHGFSRQWNCKGSSISFSTTYLGVLPHKGKSFGAVVYKLSNIKSLLDYDSRESLYCREEVPMSKIRILSDKRKLAFGQYWIYVTKSQYMEQPSREYPIVQSYVDTFLSGCFELEDKFNISGFTKECVRTTEFWESPWVNDRIFPRRPFVYQPMAGRIDRLLNEMVPRAYRNIRIE